MCNRTPSKSVEWLQVELESGGTSLLLLDCRSHELYESSHIESAINLAMTGLMLRRFKKGNIPIQTVIPKHEEKEKFIGRCKTDTVVLYDECSAEWPASGAPASVLFVLLQKLWEDGCKAFYLEGGFVKFHTEYPEHCETLLDSSCPSSSPPVSALGFGNLRISSDCSDGESTEPEESPFPSNQPDFPVQILPYLYLGCAKDSANLDVLGQYNITYILNNLSQFFPEAISFIDEARSKRCGILVHCLAGISRSVTVTVAYLMQRLNLSLNDAYDFVKRKKSNISPNFNFMGQLLDFERTLGRHTPCDNRSTSEEQLFFTTPTNHNVFQLESA
ncbi:hypothetical protein OJAV_G00067630 [Oryzias javanicus]|uniref:Dual specificity protein phosphatase n=1 Tax=Oryzias javanicus TaxID=123683 RepID=A0A3S2Q5F5_ORYJA|nr:hypothetical protein OJAV_G00067630 [Oryzias javanicus]